MSVSEPLALLHEQAATTAPVCLVDAPPLRVPFTGQRGGEGPLTLGQANTLQWVVDPTLYTRMIEWTLSLPRGCTLDDIVAALSVLLARHESLRTSYPAGHEPGTTVQRVKQSGELLADVYETVSEPPSLGVVAVELARRLRSREFDLAAELPLRVAVAVSDGMPLTAVIVYSHLAVDFGSMALIDRQFTRLASDPASRVPGPLGHQPLDQAKHERSPLGQRRAKTALASWHSHLSSASQCLYPVPAGDPDQRGEVGCGWLWSQAAALALPHIAARTGASRQLAVLAALSAVLARRASQDVCTFPVTVSNRYQQRLRDYVGTLANDGIMSVDVRASRFDELVRRTAAATLRSSHSGPIDRTALIEAMTEIEHDRGISISRACAFNDLTPYQEPVPDAPTGTPTDAHRALERSRFASLTSPPVEELLLIILHRIDPELSLGVMTRDEQKVSHAEIESLLRGTERLLVAAAARDVELDRLGEITGVLPMPRGAGWLRSDSCWVELAEAQRLLDEALGVPAVRVFQDPDAPGWASLIAYLVAGNGIQTPEQAHAACVAELAGHGRPRGNPRYTAMAPGRYVVCARAPIDRSNHAAWRQQPVLAAGTGRHCPPERSRPA